LDGTPLPPAPSPARGEGEHDGTADTGALSHSRTFALSHSQSLAYVIYTSGSTGTPKGVAVTHGALANLLHAAREAFGVRAGDVVPSLASFAFDIWLCEAILPLTVGATVRLVGRERVMDPARLVEEVSDATVLHAVPALMRQVVGEVRASAEPRLARVRRAFVGGDLVPPDLLAEMREAFPRAETHVLYGPTEATVLASSWRAPAEGAIEGHRIGAPLGNVRLYVCDAQGGAQPVGVPGELRIGGAQTARGYLGRPELTAAQFVPDPFAAEPGARAYRSGDRVRWLPTGELEFLGRTDAQVKIRGFRIEPGEVEAALERHPAVREAVAVVREDAPGERRLAAYVAAAPGETADAAELRAHLRRRLPEYMVPSAVVVLDALPLTPTGKLDRRALPAPEGAAGGEYVAPRTPAEEVLAAIWTEVLRAERVGVHDDFFALGGHSLLATRVATRVQEALGVEMPLRALFEAPTVAALAERLEAAGPGAGTAAPPLVRVPRGGPLPASFAQQRLWFVDRLHPGGAAYNLPFALRLRGAVDPRALRAALTGIAARHETLRTTFAEVDGGAVQVIGPASPVRVPAADLRALPAEAREGEARRLVAAESARPFDLERGPLLRALLVRLDRAEWALCVVVHHVAGDGWSTAVLVREVSELYSAFVEGRAPALPELPVQYADYAVWQRKLLSGEALERQLAWWRRELEGAPAALELPHDRARPAAAVAEAPGGTRRTLLAPETTAALRALARGEGATLFMTLLAAWQLLLARYSGTEDVPVGSVVAGRSRVELEGLIGFFVNTLVLRTDLSGDPSFRALLGRVRETVLGVFAHQEVPFEKLVEELAPERALGRTPFFQVMFTLRAPEGGAPEMGGVEVEPLGTAAEAVKFDLNLALTDHGERIAASLAFRADLFDGATAERMLEHFRVLLESVAADPGRPVGEARLLPAAERELVLERWNDTDAPFREGETLHGLFARQAARDPEGTAVVFDGRATSRAELDRLSARIAHGLRRRGVGPETRVALYLEPSVEMVAALLGVLRAGGAYVPLDTRAPADRAAYVLEDSAARLVLAGPGVADALPPTRLPVLRVTADAFAGEPETAPEGGADPMNLAYVIYTSGSTGRPKGVMVPHRGVCNSARAFIGAYGIRPESRVLLFAPLHFDASVLDVFTALLSGAALVVARREEMMPGEELAGLLRRERITHLKATPSALVVTPPDDLPDLETVGVGGESCGADLVALWAPGRRLFNGYGATEHSVRFTVQRCTDASRPPPVGRPVRNTRLYVLDPRLQPVPVGVPGEVYMAGVGVARGYLDRPELTAERFVPDPFRGEPGARMYRSGDRGRWLPGGTLEFVGRVDFQVKIRGFRIEPGEVEAALLEHPALLDAVVVARDDGAGGRRLCAYAVPAPGAAAPRPAELRAHLGERLPEYMVPATFTLLDALPLTSSGKTDRRALPHPDPAPGADEYVAPRTPTEAALAAIWAEVLQVERVGAADEFFALGGHSLAATRVIARAREALGVEVPLRAVFESPVLAALAARVDQLLLAKEAPAPAGEPPADDRAHLRRLLRRRADGRREEQRIRPRAGDGPVPLSFAQQRLWFIQQLDPASSAYNMPYPLRLRGALDVAALERAVTEMVRRHESLRTVFAATAGEPVQVVRPAGPVRLPVLDLSGLPPAARDAATRRRVAEESARPFDLARGPLLRVVVLRLADDDWGVVFNLHHIVSDGWSSGVLTREASALYGAFSRGEPSPLPELPVQYPDFAVWQRERIGGRVLEAQARYWREALAGAPPVLELPTDRPRSVAPGARAGAVPFALGPEASAALRELARGEGATPFIALLAAFQALLGRWSGQDDVSVGTPVAGRDRVETEGLIGFFVNTLVLRTDLSGDPTFRELLGRARETVLGAFAHQEIPFERLVEEVRVERSLRHTPLFQVLFALQNMDRGELRMGELEVDALARGEDVAKFDLSVTLAEAGGGFRGGLTFRADLFDRATVERMADHFGRLLEAVAAAPDRRLSEVEILGDAERARVLEEWNATERPFPAGERVHDLFAAQAARTPDAVAVSWRGERVTYAALDRRANRLAHALRRRGVGPETRVGVCMGRTPELLVALLGVLKAGGAYVPLDPAYPAGRLAHMVEDAGIPLVLAERRLTASLPEAVDVLAPDGARDAVAAEPDTAPESGVLPENLSHVIFTSGSTGRPKGVMIRHSSVVVLLHWLRESVSDEERRAVLFSTSISFDVSVAEIWGTLCWGGRLVLVENALELADLPAGEEVVYASMVPSAAAELLRTGGIPAGVKTLNLGGEALPAPLAQGLYALGTVERVGNLYGPTEDTTYSTYSLVEPGAEQVSIGRPVANTRAYVLDAHLRPVPPGVVGELYLAGAGLARGYAARPDLTAERFLPDPFGGPGTRMYRVMDRVRRRAGGELEYVGRSDFQVKVRGFRIELGEIEAVLARHPAVREAVAVVREDAPGDRRIVAYVTAAGAARPDAAELREHLGRHLPEYMVPSATVVLDALPLSPSGKTDRGALPAPERPAGGDGYVAPRDALELALARIWEEVLGLETVGVRDGFFALGGHSLLAVRLMARVEQATGARLPLAVLFTATTVEQLAREVRRGGAGPGGSPLVPVRPAGQRPPLFLVHPVGGDVLAYAALARHLHPEQPVYGLRSRGLDGVGEPARTVEEMAGDYLSALRRARPSGPYRLGGWSMGGVVAFEMARRLEAEGERVERLVLVDAHVPALHGRALPRDPAVLVGTFAQDMGLPPGLLALPESDAGDAGERAYLRRVLEGARAAGLVPPDLDAERIERLYAVFRANLAALHGYRPAPWSGAATLLRAAEHDPAQTESAGWERLIEGGVEVRVVPGSHFSMVREPHAEALAREVERALDG
ncbi:MAG: amino acid adenylation domain-containing protein, partial [Gemmatimonadota bacterium]